MDVIEIPVVLDNNIRTLMHKDGFQFRFDGVKRQWYMTIYKCKQPYPGQEEAYKITDAMLRRIDNVDSSDSS